MGLLVICLTVLQHCTNTHAEIVRFKLTGKVSISQTTFNVLPEDLVAGADTDVLHRPDFDAPGGKWFVAYWSYDTNVPDSRADLPYSGVYSHPIADPDSVPYGLSVQIDQYVFHLDTSVDQYTVTVGVGSLLPPDAIGGGDGIGIKPSEVIVPFEYNSPTPINDSISLSISDSIFSTTEASSLPSDELPRYLDIDEFDSARIQITGSGTVGIGSSLPPAYFIQAWINEITVVPEPSTLCLLSILVVAKLGHRRPISQWDSTIEDS